VKILLQLQEMSILNTACVLMAAPLLVTGTPDFMESTEQSGGRVLKGHHTVNKGGSGGCNYFCRAYRLSQLLKQSGGRALEGRGRASTPRPSHSRQIQNGNFIADHGMIGGFGR